MTTKNERKKITARNNIVFTEYLFKHKVGRDKKTGKFISVPLEIKQLIVKHKKYTDFVKQAKQYKLIVKKPKKERYLFPHKLIKRGLAYDTKTKKIVKSPLLAHKLKRKAEKEAEKYVYTGYTKTLKVRFTPTEIKEKKLKVRTEFNWVYLKLSKFTQTPKKFGFREHTTPPEGTGSKVGGRYVADGYVPIRRMARLSGWHEYRDWHRDPLCVGAFAYSVYLYLPKTIKKRRPDGTYRRMKIDAGTVIMSVERKAGSRLDDLNL